MVRSPAQRPRRLRSVGRSVLLLSVFSLVACGAVMRTTFQAALAAGGLSTAASAGCARLLMEAPPSEDGLSSHQCIDGRSVYHRVCVFKDIYMFNGTLFYVVPDETDQAQFRLPEISLRFMQVGEDFMPGGDWLSNRTMLPATRARLEVLAAGAPRGSMPQVVFWSTWVVPNYYHTFGEFLPTLHATLCKYLGKCTYNAWEAIQTIDLLPLPRLHSWPAWFHDALRCLTAAPYLHIRSPEVAGRLVRIGSALMGVGSSCRARQLCSGRKLPHTTDRKNIEREQMVLWRERLGACLGLDARAEAPTSRPQILLVDRPEGQARHLVNIHNLTAAVQEAYGGFANVSLVYMEGLSLRQQAALWSSVSVAAYVHGAALANWVFMPRNSVVVQIVPRPRPGHHHDVNFTKHMELDMQGVTNWTCINLVNPSYRNLEWMRERLWEDIQWQRLSGPKRLAVTQKGNCSVVPKMWRGYSCERGWFTLAINLKVEPRLLLVALGRALEDLFRKSGRPPPPGFTPEPPFPRDLRQLYQLQPGPRQMVVPVPALTAG